MPKPPKDSGPTVPLAQVVDEAIANKIKEWRRLVIAFLAGLAVLVGVLSPGSVRTFVHDQFFPFDDRMEIALRGSVAVSYNNGFTLGTDSTLAQSESIPFYADSGQDARAIIRIFHFGAKRRLPVSIKLDHTEGLTLLSDTLDGIYEIDLTREFNPSGGVAREAGWPSNVHFLTFEVNEEGDATDDRVFIRSLINVFGLEKNQR